MGDLEFGKCDMCKNDAPVNRQYYYYDIKCDCCNSRNDDHFEIVRYCKNCTPIPPRQISLSIKPTT